MFMGESCDAEMDDMAGLSKAEAIKSQHDITMRNRDSFLELSVILHIDLDGQSRD
jgi:hypothetical protein